MDLFQSLVLAIIQGFTEFLPISSSAHLILLPKIFGWSDQGLAFDVAVHVGTLMAVICYFWQDLKKLTKAWLASIFKLQASKESRIAWSIGFATIPVGLAGLAFKSFIENNLRSAIVIAIATIVFGVLLGISSTINSKRRGLNNIGWKDVLVIGGAQALALIPGTSRSGITITAGLLMGLEEKDAARYAFLLSIPVIVLAGGLEAIELMHAKVLINWQLMLTGIVFSFITAFFTIKLFLNLLDKIGFTPFVLYRIALGLFLIAVF